MRIDSKTHYKTGALEHEVMICYQGDLEQYKVALATKNTKTGGESNTCYYFDTRIEAVRAARDLGDKLNGWRKRLEAAK